MEKSSFIDSSRKIINSGSEFINKINEVQNNRTDAGEIPLEAIFGLDEKSDIDLFFHDRNKDYVQFYSVKGNMSLGKFTNDAEVGLEIVLENSDLAIDMSMARANETYISGNNTWEKEKVRHFMDPAAFFATHYDYFTFDKKQGDISTVYTKVLNPYLTKNTIYLDIRNENGYSYNYYNNYPDSTIKIGNTNTPATEFNNNGWPVYIIKDTDLPQGSNSLFVALKRNTQQIPQAAVVKVYAESSTKEKHKNKGTYFLNKLEAESDNFVKSIEISFSKVTENTDTKPIASIIRLDYIRKKDPTIVNAAPFYSTSRSNLLFGPIDFNNPWYIRETSNIKWGYTGLNRYISESDKTLLLKSGIVEERTTESNYNYIYYTSPYIELTEKNVSVVNDSFNFQSNSSTESNFFATYNLNNKKNKIKNETVNIFNEPKVLFTYENKINASQTYFLAISHQEREYLLDTAQSSLSNKHKKNFIIKKAADNEYGYTLSVAGMNESFQYTESDCNIVIYSFDGKIFTSDGYLGDTPPLQLPTFSVSFTLKDDYYDETDPKNHFGFDWFRDEYIGTDGLCIDSNKEGVSNKEDAQRELKNEYEPLLIGGKDYYVPWLTLMNYPAGTNPNAIPERYKATLKLKMGGRAPMAAENEHITFIPSDGVKIEIINPADGTVYSGVRIKANDVAKAEIKIACNEIDNENSNRSVTILGNCDRLVGKLNIYRNITSTKNIKFIKVNFTGTLNGLNGLNGRSLTFNNTNIILNVGNSNEKTYLNNHNSSNVNSYWEGWLENPSNQNFTKNILQQFLIDYNPDSFNYDAELKVQFNNKENVPKLTLIQPDKIDIVKYGSTDDMDMIYDHSTLEYDTEYQIPVMICYESAIIVIRDLIEYASKEFRNDNICVFTLPIAFKETDGTDKNFQNAFALSELNLVYLTGHPKIVTKDTLPHEILHCFSLSHTFTDDPERNRENKKFIFTRKKTDNIMDYGTDVKHTSWKWQVKKVTENSLDNNHNFPPTAEN